MFLNPYLPLNEYVPDGEPRLFHHRVYIYGSHDVFGKFPFCYGDYVTYSCPEDDLSSWRYEGVIFHKKDDPKNRKGRKSLFAPDVIEGNDGKYYLYYSSAWSGIIGVANSSSPSGPFRFFNYVRHPDGTLLGKKKGDPFQFDPGIFIDDDKRIYLYSGFGAVSYFPQIPLNHRPQGAFVYELGEDMVTIVGNPVKIASKADEKENLNHASTGHSFFEASSLRKIRGIYYFIYSSLEGHELCYMTSESPRGPFTYRGVIVSNGDVGINGREKKDALYPLGNNHGSLLVLKDRAYIFYHRHTNYTNTDRQGCIEPVTILEDGTIQQAEMTSSGASLSPLKGEGRFPASVCCVLLPKKGNVFYPFFRTPFKTLKETYITQKKDRDSGENVQYIHNIQDGCLVGYKYFDLEHTRKVVLDVQGNAHGKISVLYEEDGKPVSSVNFVSSDKKKSGIALPLVNGKKKSALYFRFETEGKLDFFSFDLVTKI